MTQPDPDPELRRCSRCRQFKPTPEFNWRRKQLRQRDSYCRPCRADYKQEHYAANRQRYVNNDALWRRGIREQRTSFLLTFFESHPCVDCGEADPRVLEFDHRGGKSFDVSNGFTNRPWPQVLAEIDKCDVRCANCHRRKTARQLGFYRARLLDGQLSQPAGPRG